MSDYFDTEEGEVCDMDRSDIDRDLVANIHQGGIAYVMSMPDSPDDMDKNLTQMVLMVGLTTYGGEKMNLMFMEEDVRKLYNITNDYRRVLQDDGVLRKDVIEIPHAEEILEFMKQMLKGLEDE